MKPDYSTISIFTEEQHVAASRKTSNYLIDQSAGVAPFTRASRAAGNVIEQWHTSIPPVFSEVEKVQLKNAKELLKNVEKWTEKTIFQLEMGANLVENIAFMRAWRTVVAIQAPTIVPQIAVEVTEENEFRAIFQLTAAIIGEATVIVAPAYLMSLYLSDEVQLQRSIDALGGAAGLETKTESLIALFLAK